MGSLADATGELKGCGGRQYGTTIDRIKRDHVERYRWASDRLPKTGVILDAGCGIGYGSCLLAEPEGRNVIAVDRDNRVVEAAKSSWPHPRVEYRTANLHTRIEMSRPRGVCCLEVWEHLCAPELFLDVIQGFGEGLDLIVSTPNSETSPKDLGEYHVRLWSPEEFLKTVELGGFEIIETAGQRKPTGIGEYGLNHLLIHARRTSEIPLLSSNPYQFIERFDRRINDLADALFKSRRNK